MYLTIDIGGTKTALASFRQPDPQYKIDEMVIPTQQNYSQALEDLITQIHKLSHNQPITAISLSIPARITDNQTIGLQSNIPDYVGHNPTTDLQKIFNTQTIMHNDAVCAALAEAAYGAGQNVLRLLHIIMGTGTGAAFVVNHSDFRQVIPLEPSYMIVEPSGKSHHSHPTKGMLSAYISSLNLEKQIGQSLNQIADNHPIWDQVVKYLTLGVYNLTVLLNPTAITFSGGYIQKRPHLIDQLKQSLIQYQDTLISPPPISLSAVPGNASLLGALAFIDPTKNPRMGVL